MYYLKSRYYDPEVCRFINADAFVSTGQGIIGYNMFAYCGNNPVASSDPSGHYIGHRPIMVCDKGAPLSEKKSISMMLAICEITHSSKYSEKAWEGLTSDERWFLILDYADEVKQAMGLNDIAVAPFLSDSGVVGCYSHSERVLYINRVLECDRDMALFTVRHELYHCYQNILCDNLPNNSSSIPTSKIQSWDENRKPENYITDGPGYVSQPLERDADLWAERTG